MATKSNRNVLPKSQTTFYGLPIITHRGPVDVDYLNSICGVLESSIEEYTRVCAIRIDLRFPTYAIQIKRSVISAFIDSLNEQIKADLKRKQKNKMRKQSCNLRYVWVKERCTSLNSHYHVLLLVNKDVYHCLGSYKAKSGNMASRIMKAWATAIGLSLDESMNLVNFPENPIYYIDSGKDGFHKQFSELFYRASYFAKVETKEYGTKERSFGCSRK